jgi:hypothetical protein
VELEQRIRTFDKDWKGAQDFWRKAREDARKRERERGREREGGGEMASVARQPEIQVESRFN